VVVDSGDKHLGILPTYHYTYTVSLFTGRLSRKNFGLGVLCVAGVPALLGILAAIVFASLGEARLKAQQAYMQEEAQQQRIDQALQGSLDPATSITP